MTPTTQPTTTPDGIGNVAAKAVLDYRHRDDSNQLTATPTPPATIRSTPTNQSTTPGAVSRSVSSPRRRHRRGPPSDDHGHLCVGPHYANQGSSPRSSRAG